MSGDGVASTISKHSDTAPIGTALTVDDGERVLVGWNAGHKIRVDRRPAWEGTHRRDLRHVSRPTRSGITRTLRGYPASVHSASSVASPCAVAPSVGTSRSNQSRKKTTESNPKPIVNFEIEIAQTRFCMRPVRSLATGRFPDVGIVARSRARDPRAHCVPGGPARSRRTRREVSFREIPAPPRRHRRRDRTPIPPPARQGAAWHR